MTEEETCTHQCADDICGEELTVDIYCDHPGICCECEDQLCLTEDSVSAD